MRLCKEKIRRARAQLEIDLVSSVKENKKCFHINISNKRSTEENLWLLLDAENTVVQGEEKDEGLNSFFASVFSPKTSCLLGTQPHGLEDRDGEQSEGPIVQEETTFLATCPPPCPSGPVPSATGTTGPLQQPAVGKLWHSSALHHCLPPLHGWACHTAPCFYAPASTSAGTALWCEARAVPRCCPTMLLSHVCHLVVRNPLLWD